MSYIEELGIAAKKAERAVTGISVQQKNAALKAISDKLLANKELIIKENAKDLENAKSNGISQVMLDRLALTEKRIDAMCDGVLQLISLNDPIGEVLGGRDMPNGLHIIKKRVPLGVIGIIFESSLPRQIGKQADAAALQGV